MASDSLVKSGGFSLTPESFIRELDSSDLMKVLPKFKGDIEDNKSRVEYWREYIPWFKEELEVRIVTISRDKARNSNVSLRKLNNFLSYYMETGLKIDSSKRCGLTWPTVKKRLDPDHPLYSQSFRYAFDCIESEKIAKVNDAIYQKAIEGDGSHPGSFKALSHIDRMEHKRKSLELKNKKEDSSKNIPRPVNVVINTIAEKARLTGKVVEVK